MKFPIAFFIAAATMAAQGSLPSVRDLKYPPLRQVSIPDITTFTLPNGMRVYMLENHELPVVSGSATIRTGNLFDPTNKVGLAGITGTVIRSGGTKTRTGEQLDEALENIAASVESNIGETSGSVSFNALRENTDEVLALFKDVLTSPEFRQDKLDLAKTQVRSAIARRNDNAGGIASREFAAVIYGRNNPFGWDMNYEHIDNIKREDVTAFYQRYFFPANTMLAVYGDFKPAEMRARIEKLFADWTVKQEAVPPFPKVTPQSTAPGIYQATKSDVTQTFFEMGHIGGILRDKDYPALSVLSQILGGSFASRLVNQVRTAKGLAYNVGGGWGANYSHEGLFEVSGSTKSASTVETLQAVREEIDKMRTSEVTDQELATAKQSVLNSFIFAFDHPRKILNRFVTYEYHGYPKDFIFQYQKAIENVTKADVLRVAKEKVNPERLTIVAVGNPKDFGTPLSKLGAVKELDLTIPDPSKPVSKADPASLARGKQMMDRARKALGGGEKIAAVKDVSHTTEVTVANGMKITQNLQWVRPDVMRQVQTLPFGKVTVVWNGKQGWLVSPQGTMPLPPPVQNQMTGELFRLPFILYDPSTDITANAVADNTVEVKHAAGQSVRIEFDPATGLPMRTTYQSVGMQGAPQQVTGILSDWRDVNGIKIAHKAVIEQGGQKFGEAVMSEVKINSGLSADEVGKQP